MTAYAFNCISAVPLTRALGHKVSDEFTVPLCRGHHREVHRYGDEAKWWSKAAIDPLAAARALWVETHPALAARTDNVADNAAAPPASYMPERP
jgi:hypothetical protein